MILVVGGTGRLGRRVVGLLRASAEQVAVLCRHPDRADDLRAAGVRMRRGDVRDEQAVREAMSGASVVVSAMHGLASWGTSPADVDAEGNETLTRCAAVHGADVVLVSVVGAAADHPLELFRAKAAAEAMLHRHSVPWTIVRSGPFIELHEHLLRQGPRALVLGRGTTPIDFTSVDAVAAVVCSAVRDPTRRGSAMEVPVAERLTMDELAARVRADGLPPRHVPRGVLRGLAATGSLWSTPLSRVAATALFLDGPSSDVAART